MRPLDQPVCLFTLQINTEHFIPGSLLGIKKGCLTRTIMNKADMSKYAKDLNSALLSLNTFMLEQSEINDYDQLIKSINDQLEQLLDPIAVVYSEYGKDSNVFKIKEIKASQVVLDLVEKYGLKKIFSVVIPVTGDMYKDMTGKRVKTFPDLYETSNGAVSKTVSNILGKTFKIKCFLGLSYTIEGQAIGATTTALKEEPDPFTAELLKTYAHFTSISLKRVLTEQALKNSEQELKTITENMTDLVSMTDMEGKCTYISGSYKQMLGYEKEELLGQTVFDVIHSDDLPNVLSRFQNAITEGKDDNMEYRVVKKDGSVIWVETIGNILFDNQGHVKGALFVNRDITERKIAEKALKENEKKYRFLAENMGDVVWIRDSEMKLTYVSPSVYNFFGFTPEERMQQTIDQTMTPESLTAVFQTIQEELAKEKDSRHDPDREIVLEAEYYHKNGGTVWVEHLIKAMRDSSGEFQGIYGSSRDITERKKAEEKIRYIGYHDSLTKLYNRHYFEKCKDELKDTPVVSVIMTDVNGLKLINDIYGHKAGDELLKKYAELLRKTFKATDLFFRWGGDEFIIILKETEKAKSWELCNRLIKHCGETLLNNIPLSISCGVSSKLPGEDIVKAIQEAEDMMYSHKLNESKISKSMIMKTLLQTLAEKSFETKEHIDRMSFIGKKFGKKLSLLPSELSRLDTLVMLHDIGKISIDGHILMKKTDYTDEECEKIKKHPEIGYRITRTTEEFAYIAEEILTHHERWDGKGYPQGLKGESIPYLARILNLIDSYDVMTRGRPYKKKSSYEEIIAEIKRCSGKQFDPDLAEEFVAFLKENEL